MVATSSSDDDLLVRVFVDSLTGLATWELFRDRVRTTLSADAARRCAAIILLDIDDFSVVNRKHGYTIGDRVLAAVAERIVGTVRDSSATARIGANTFGILLRAPTAGNGKNLARRLLARMKAPLDLGEAHVRLTASAGFAVASAASDADQLIAQAATALAGAKSAGGDRLVVFQAGAAPAAHRYESDDHATPDRMARRWALGTASPGTSWPASISPTSARPTS